MKKLFGGLRFTWGRLILFALICGLYTGLTTLMPFAKETSLQDISISFEWWILFAILIIVNSESPLDAGFKVFVFFLISQPLVYLVQVPFHADGFGIFRYYPAWFRWTLLTFPMAYVGYFMKRDRWWGLLILAPMLVFLGFHFKRYLQEALSFFPNHLLSALFCAATLLLYPLGIFRNRKIRLAGLVLSLAILLVFGFLAIGGADSNAYETDLLLSGGETAGTEFDESWSVSLEDESFGSVSIRHEDVIESFLVHASLTKTGSTRLILRSPEGERFVYSLDIQRHSYEIRRITPNP